MKLSKFLENPFNIVKVILLAVISVSVFIFTHQLEFFIFFAIGFLWIFLKDSPDFNDSLQKKKYRLSFIRLYCVINENVDELVQATPFWRQSLIRSMVPTLLILGVSFALQSRVMWWCVFLGAISCELFKRNYRRQGQ